MMPRRSSLPLSLVISWLVVACGPSGSSLPPPLPPPPPVPAEEIPEGSTDAAATATDSVGEAVLFGHFRHVGGEADLEARDAAIDAVAAEVPFMAREKVGRRLRERTKIVPELTIEEQGSELRVDFGGKVVLAAPNGGPPIPFTPPNSEDEVKLTHAMDGPRLVQIMQSDNGGTRRVYTPQAGGKLVVQVAVYSSRLPRTIAFDLHYALVDEAEAP